MTNLVLPFGQTTIGTTTPLTGNRRPESFAVFVQTTEANGPTACRQLSVQRYEA